jgi:succinate dehydrogenase/fumarate reductase-like Fe-S protein
MHINGKGRFACLQSVQDIMKKDEVKVEPIRNVPVLKDLVYDMETFLFRKIKNLRPGVRSAAVPAGMHELDDAQLAPLRHAMTCHMCGLCDEGCTVIVVDKDFMGPAALTKAYRYDGAGQWPQGHLGLYALLRGEQPLPTGYRAHRSHF